MTPIIEVLGVRLDKLLKLTLLRGGPATPTNIAPILLAASAIILVVAIWPAYTPGSGGVYLPLRPYVLLAACAGLALQDAGPPRTCPLSSLLYCAGLLGWQLLAVLARTTSSVEQLRDETVHLRASGRLLMPPFAIVGAIFLVLGAGMGFQQLPLLHKLQVACFEIALFTHSPRLDITRSRYGAPEPPERLIGRG